jgi:hypothetical protein
MKRTKKYYARQDSETGEWFFNGKYYDHYPGQEVEDWNESYDRYMEDKADEMRDEGEKP